MTTPTPETFLGEVDAREIPWSKPAGAPSALTTDTVLIGQGVDGLEVALATATTEPRVADVRSLWKKRWGGRAAPVLLVVTYPDGQGGYKASVCGTKDDPAVIPSLPLDQLERICTAALLAPNPAEAERTVHRLLVSQKDQLIAGLTNHGLFASHELRHGVPTRPDWMSAKSKAAPLLGRRGADLLTGLGYTSTPLGSTAQILSVNGTQQAIAVLLDDTELFDRPINRFGALSPVAQGLRTAQEQNLDWLVLTRGTQIRLYPAKSEVGVGRKGQTDTFVELDLALLTAEDAGYLTLIFGPDALAPTGSVSQILAASADHAAGLGTRLRDRVYKEVVPHLAPAIAKQMGAISEEDLHEAYHRTLIILFRLLFVAYAEDSGLLPYQRNPRYTSKALKTLARELAANPDMEFDSRATDRWEDLLAVWKAVDDGNTEWGVPAYNGGLFAADEDHPSGRAIAQMRLTNQEIGPALRWLLIDKGDDGTTGPVDFRALTVREFGTIYEGLLESSLSIAPTDLTIDPKTEAYLPTTDPENRKVAKGDIYFHNASGARKSSGSFYTKDFAVQSLLESALEPALSDHLSKVQALWEAGDEAGAADAFFDFRVADLAMGSGHFLVAAIDRIEVRFRAFLDTHPIPWVMQELDELEQEARKALGPNATDVEIERSTLLRRQIARRCLYGLDLNLMAVELARLGIWIHTFVPGLPMSGLDHGLVVGNSLTGIGTLDEALDVYEPRAGSGQFSLFGDQIEEALATARDRLIRVARTTEATKSKVRDAARQRAKAMAEAADAKALLDAAVAIRLGMFGIPAGPDEAIALGKQPAVQAKIEELQSAHLLYLFPEVFMRDQPGFDVVLGNPPWDEVMVEEPKFWQRFAPGVMGLRPAAQKKRIKELRAERPDLLAELELEQQAMADLRAVLMSGPYPGLTRGDVDFYKAFSWRDWTVLRNSGRMGVVFPRSLLNAAGSAPWRNTVLTEGHITSAVTLSNTNKWVFDDVHGQYTVVLLSLHKQAPKANDAAVYLSGPFHSLADFEAGATRLGRMPATTLTDWDAGAAFPLLPSAQAAGVFAKYRQHPRFDDRSTGRDFRYVAEFHATNDRRTFDAGGERPGRWPVITGATFNLWDPDAGDPYTWANAKTVVSALQNKRKRQARTSSSAFYDLPANIVNDPETLPCMRPRLAFRDVTNQTNTRTVIAALVPGHAVLTNTAPYLLRRSGTLADEAYLLGVLSSIPLDWYARRFVELHVNQHILHGFPIPNPDVNDPLRQRVIEIAGRLAAVDGRFTDWAAEVGVPVGSVTDEAIKADLITELDACVALLYGLDRDDVVHIFETFHRGWAYQDRLNAVLGHFDKWKNKVQG